MKKSVLIGAGIGIGTSVLIVLCYILMITKKNTNVPVETTTSVYVPEQTKGTVTVEEAKETAAEETSEAVPSFSITYGDFNETVSVPESVTESFDAFMENPVVSQILGELIFDGDVEWAKSSWEFTDGVVFMRGAIPNSTGYMEFTMDTVKGTCDIIYQGAVSTYQTRDDFVRPGRGAILTTYPAGSSLDDVNAQTINTKEFKFHEFSDWEKALYPADGEIPDTIRIVMSEYSSGADMISTYMSYMRYYFGDGEIIVWDYEKLENSTVIIYASIDRWNVSVQVSSSEPFVLYTTAQLSK